MTKIAQFFLEPKNSTHRQYEALRAFFVDNVPAEEVANRFGYTYGSLRNLCYNFRQDTTRTFFVPTCREHLETNEEQFIHETIIALRKQNFSIYDISEALFRENKIKRSPASIANVLENAGFSKLPRRGEEERPSNIRVETAAVADVHQCDLSPRSFHTKYGGLFLFVPYLANIPFGQMLAQVGLPGSKMIPAMNAMLSLLALKLSGNARKAHVMSYVFDQGLALFAGLNVIPKRSFLTEYSCRINPNCHLKLMSKWFDAVGKLGLKRGVSFDLDFHAIPFHGEDALLQKHYVSKRSRRQKGILAFLVRDDHTNVICYADAEIRKEKQNDAILEFVKYWKKRTGKFPEELVFDSKVTTYKNLSFLNTKHIDFITVRRRTLPMLDEINATPRSAWRKIKLENVSRKYRTPRILDRKIALNGYKGAIRQITITDLGHDNPTILLTNQLRRSASKVIGRYAQRMLIENGIEDNINFFHMDALSSAVALKVNVDLQLTMMGSSLYRILGAEVGHGYEVAKSPHIFRDFIDAAATVNISEHHITVKFQKRAHNPLLFAAGFDKVDIPVPWLGGKHLQFIFE